LKVPGTEQWLSKHRVLRQLEIKVSNQLWLHGIRGSPLCHFPLQLLITKNANSLNLNQLGQAKPFYRKTNISIIDRTTAQHWQFRAGIIEWLGRSRTLSEPQEVVAYFDFDFKGEIGQKA